MRACFAPRGAAAAVLLLVLCGLHGACAVRDAVTNAAVAQLGADLAFAEERLGVDYLGASGAWLQDHPAPDPPAGGAPPLASELMDQRAAESNINPLAVSTYVTGFGSPAGGQLVDGSRFLLANAAPAIVAAVVGDSPTLSPRSLAIISLSLHTAYNAWDSCFLTRDALDAAAQRAVPVRVGDVFRRMLAAYNAGVAGRIYASPAAAQEAFTAYVARNAVQMINVFRVPGSAFTDAHAAALQRLACAPLGRGRTCWRTPMLFLNHLLNPSNPPPLAQLQGQDAVDVRNGLEAVQALWTRIVSFFPDWCVRGEVLQPMTVFGGQVVQLAQHQDQHGGAADATAIRILQQGGANAVYSPPHMTNPQIRITARLGAAGLAQFMRLYPLSRVFVPVPGALGGPVQDVVLYPDSFSVFSPEIAETCTHGVLNSGHAMDYVLFIVRILPSAGYSAAANVRVLLDSAERAGAGAEVMRSLRASLALNSSGMFGAAPSELAAMEALWHEQRLSDVPAVSVGPSDFGVNVAANVCTRALQACTTPAQQRPWLQRMLMLPMGPMSAIPAVRLSGQSAFRGACRACAMPAAQAEAAGGKLRACVACKGVAYCSQACQRADWSRHKPPCRAQAAALATGGVDAAAALEDATCFACRRGLAPQPGGEGEPELVNILRCGHAGHTRCINALINSLPFALAAFCPICDAPISVS